MRTMSRALVVALGCAVVAGCAGTDARYGKGNDHEVAYTIGDRRNENRPLHPNAPVTPVVTPQPSVVYVQPVQPVTPAYVYYPPTPQYQVVPVVRAVPTTRYVYLDN